MGVGIFLIMIGAILAFAVRAESDVVDLQIMGLILILGGIAAIYYSRMKATTERHVTRIEDKSNPRRIVRTVHESVRDPDAGDDVPRTRS
jgi:hypothetical protein